MASYNPQSATYTTTATEIKQAKFASSAAAYGSLALVSTHNGDELAGKDDSDYPFNHLKPSFPKVDWPPLEEFETVDKARSAPSQGKPKKENLILKKASGYKFLTPALGVEVRGLNLTTLTDDEKNDFALLAAQTGVVVVREQNNLTIDEQLEFGRYLGKLHKHATTAVPKSGDLDEIHLVYADQYSRPDNTAFKKKELYHSDVTYELQPPSLTSLRLVVQPETGGDTIFSSGYAVYSSFSKGFQTYLESLSAVHSAVAQANGSQAAGNHVRRAPVETVHPVVRVNPATGLKSVFVNPGFTRRIIGVPKTESDAILEILFDAFSASPDFQVRASWEEGTVVFWDNRVVNHSALFDFYPSRRHGVRVTPHGERPISVADYEAKYSTKAKDWAEERAKELGVSTQQKVDVGGVQERGYKD